jgi:hypothetical protein
VTAYCVAIGLKLTLKDVQCNSACLGNIANVTQDVPQRHGMSRVQVTHRRVIMLSYAGKDRIVHK